MNLAVILTLLEGVVTKSPTVIADVEATVKQFGLDKTSVLKEIEDVLSGALKVLEDVA